MSKHKPNDKIQIQFSKLRASLKEQGYPVAKNSKRILIWIKILMMNWMNVTILKLIPRY